MNKCGVLLLQSDGSRIYTIDKRKRKLPAYIVRTLKIWNVAPEHSNETIDEKFVGILMVSFIGTNRLAQGEINRKIHRFVQDLYRFRVKGNEARFHKFKHYFDKKIDDLKNVH